jgi:hypothetical protein
LFLTHPKDPELNSFAGPVFWRKAEYPIPFAKAGLGVGHESKNFGR